MMKICVAIWKEDVKAKGKRTTLDNTPAAAELVAVTIISLIIFVTI